MKIFVIVVVLLYLFVTINCNASSEHLHAVSDLLPAVKRVSGKYNDRNDVILTSSFKLKSVHDSVVATTTSTSLFMTPTMAKCMLCIASCMYGSNYITTKLLQDNLPAPMVTMLRFAIATVFFVPSLVKFFINKSNSMSVIVGSLELGLWCAIGFISQSTALQYTSASKAAFTCGLGVILPPLYDFIADTFSNSNSSSSSASSVAKFRLKRSKRDAFMTNFIPPVFALIGAGILEYSGIGEPPSWRDVFLLITPISFSMCFWKSERHARIYPQYTEVVTGTMLGTSTVLLFIWTLLSNEFPLTSLKMDVFMHAFKDWRISATLLFTGIMTTAWTSYIEQRAIKVITAADTTLIYSLEPIFAAVFASIFLKERIALTTVAGGAFILLGTTWNTLRHMMNNKFVHI